MTQTAPTLSSGQINVFRNAFGPPHGPAPAGKPAPKPAPAPTKPGMNASQIASGQQFIQQLLDPIGLGALGTWAWNTFVAAGGGTNGQDTVTAELPNQQAFKARFPAIGTLEKQGLSVPDATKAYIQYETSARQAFSQYGLPMPTTGQEFNDTIAGLINNNVSTNELQDRISTSFDRVLNAPPEVLQAAEGMFGVNSTAALAHAFLNGGMDNQTIERLSQSAEVQGTAQRFGIDINADKAQQLQRVGADQNLGNFAQLALQAPLYDRQAGEVNDLNIANQGVNAAFGADATSQAAVERQLMARKALTSGGGGEPYTQSSLSATPGESGLGQGPV